MTGYSLVPPTEPNLFSMIDVEDKMMADYEQEFPGYAFAKNAGYGTKEHLSGIDKFGVTPIHRRSFEPIKSIIKK